MSDENGIFTVFMRLEYIGTVEGTSKEDAKRRCGSILEELTKAVKPWSQEHFHLTIDKIDEPKRKDGAK